ncbi:hypothetical protein KQI61_05895 [Anaerocolumna aminovalerica]|uniref:hypothetical protein n=1 Tax=Anaerocolumna aminovalerica TaxID=1527 RepID=UPI001C0F2DD8|nr:hypothetical protein [Anaerocolumna aminovalerica]MBU5331722.1 hypothetical protein [Anaerocolumna aminovalerica]
MKELINKVTVTGVLVKNGIEEFTTKKGNEAIGGDLILRTADDSEHQISFFAHKYKKDENGNFTSELGYFYEKYLDAKNNLKDIEHTADDEKPDIISISDGKFEANDFKSQDGNVISNNKITAKFINRVEPKDYDSTILEAKFEVEGIIESIKDEIVKNVPTGNLIVTLNAIKQNQTDFKNDNSYEVDVLVPIKMTVDKSMANAFRTAGYYDGCYAKFVGTLINTAEIVETVEKQNFGEDIVRKVKTYIRKNEIKSGSSVSTIFEHDLNQEVVDALIAKRKQTLIEIKNGVVSKNNSTDDGKETQAPPTTYNPFAQN